ncbi:hypothetical protein VMCG_05267 [Cytospora schulzeri]|uniref:Uncharacterized protein n=1 Tax=Cytospora schulzeri TaxID=448051 RepID=A0A423WQU5_9PEZI|nr:hypothetical protein VMCG_05267 [Valsa malicola]
MPPINQAAVSAGVIAVSVAVAAAIAIYESPELQRMATDLRRRIALALHSLGDGIGGPHQNSNGGEPLFNRPEDAEGFLQTGGEIDADDESRRRQREELLYWNAIKLSKELERQTDENEKVKEKEKEKEKMGSSGTSTGTTFDDFLREDKSADEKGTYVFNTGAEVRDNDEGLLRRRGATEGVRGLNASLYANPFADEHGIDYDDRMDMSEIAPGTDEVTSQDNNNDDIYNATPRNDDDVITNSSTTTKSESRTMSPELVSLDPIPVPVPASQQPETAVSGGEDEYEYMTAGQSDRNNNSSNSDADDAYASIQAWAEQQQQAQQHNRESSLAFYSPLPVTPAAPLSEAMSEDGELVNHGGDASSSSSSGDEIGEGDGQMTPTDSGSVAGSGVDVANDFDAASQKSSSVARYYDVLSEDEDGMPTPAHSWTEVGSVVSESEDGSRVGAARV